MVVAGATVMQFSTKFPKYSVQNFDPKIYVVYLEEPSRSRVLTPTPSLSFMVKK